MKQPKSEKGHNKQRGGCEKVQNDAHGNHINLLSLNIISSYRRFPKATVALAIIIIIYHVQSVMWRWTIYVEPWPTDVCENVFSLTLAGQAWRPFLSWLPHLNYIHVMVNVTYLLVAGTIVERAVGSVKMLVIFFGANWSGSWSATFWDPHYQSLVGSSDGIHGLLAYYCLWEASTHYPFRLLNVALLAIYFSMWYMAIYNLILAKMPWPFSGMLNGGVDHIGGIFFASVLAGYDTWKCLARK